MLSLTENYCRSPGGGRPVVYRADPRANQFRALRSALLGRQKRLGCYFSRHFNLELGLLLRDYPLWGRPGAQGVLSPGTRKWSIGSNPSPSSMIALISFSASRFSEQTVFNLSAVRHRSSSGINETVLNFRNHRFISLTVLVYKGNVHHYKDRNKFTLHVFT